MRAGVAVARFGGLRSSALTVLDVGGFRQALVKSSMFTGVWASWGSWLPPAPAHFSVEGPALESEQAFVRTWAWIELEYRMCPVSTASSDKEMGWSLRPNEFTTQPQPRWARSKTPLHGSPAPSPQSARPPLPRRC
jgi:hypothetical protein